jgi:hypothetical protein
MGTIRMRTSGPRATEKRTLDPYNNAKAAPSRPPTFIPASPSIIYGCADGVGPVLVSQAGMFVQMRMRFGNRPFVLVLMMLVVNVQMLMKHDLVHMEMTMSLSDQHPHSNDHERGASEFRQTGKIAKHRNRSNAPTNGAVAKYADSRAAPSSRSAFTASTILTP